MRNACLAIALLVGILFLIPQTGMTDESIVGSGDPEIDQNMRNINAKARENMKDFAQRLGSKFGVSPEVVDGLITERKMSPADAHMALNVAKTAHKPVDEVADAYEQDKDKGWGVIAREMGIKPGSAEFRELKANSKSGYGEHKPKAKSKGEGKPKNKGKGKSE